LQAARQKDGKLVQHKEYRITKSIKCTINYCPASCFLQSYGDSIAISWDWRIMETLKWSDQQKIAEFVRDLYGLDTVKIISERVVERLNTLIGANSTFIVVNKRLADPPDLLVENLGPEYHKLMATIWTYRHDHPGFRYHHAYAVRAVTLSDLLPLNRWRKTELFNQAYSKLGMHEQMIGVFSFARPGLAGVIVNRTRRTFTERDRSVLNILRFHISEACRTAKMHAGIPSPSLMETLEPVVGGSIVVLDEMGRVKFCSKQAQNYLEIFFPAEKPFRGGLPLTVEKWARREIAAFGTNELAVRPPKSLDVQRGERSLQIRLASTGSGTVHILVLRAEDPTLQLKKLSSFGLGPRATEVLYWISKGKTNGEIAILLGARPRTIEKHVEAILAKLGVENRVTAALVATQGTL
jgi:DNA-binding CsgD family transcriptional regulator